MSSLYLLSLMTYLLWICLMSYDLSMSYVLYVLCISSYILCLMSYMSYAYFVPQRTRLDLVAQVTTRVSI